jgi:hypothetical protein
MTSGVVIVMGVLALLANGFLIVGGLMRGGWIREPWTKEEER